MPGRKKTAAPVTTAARDSRPSEAVRSADTANGERGVASETVDTGGARSSSVPVTVHRVAHEARSVSLAGDFNEWSPSTHPMTREGDVFAITVELEAGRRHRYLFVVDGERWEEDPTAVLSEENPFGGRNSVVDLSDRLPDQPVV